MTLTPLIVRRQGWTRRRPTTSSLDRDDSLTLHREIHRVGNEAFMVRFFVQAHGDIQVRAGAHDNLRTQHSMGEMPLALGIPFDHASLWLIDILKDIHIVDSAQMQVPELVTSRHRREQQVFRIPPVWIIAKRRVGRAR